MYKFKSILLIILFYSLCALSEPWPISSFNSQHQINGTFGECRSKTIDEVEFQRHHLHDGVDILATNNTNVYPTLSGTVDDKGSNWVRTKHRYYENGEWITEYSEFWHLKDIAVDVDDGVTASSTLLGKTDTNNHVHYIAGKTGDYVQNPLLTLYPYIDTRYPVFSATDAVRVISDINASTADDATFVNLTAGLLEGDIVDIIVDVHDEISYGDNLGIYYILVEIFPSGSANSIYDREFKFVNTSLDSVD